MQFEVFENGTGISLGTASSKKGLSSLLKKHPHRSTVRIGFDLAIPLEAHVIRVQGEPEAVILASGKTEHWTDRATSRHEGPDYLGVSCDPSGDLVPVDTINLEFRDVEDTATDRGIVWVRPGPDASAWLVLKPANIDDTEDPFDIVSAAFAAVQSKVLDKIVH